MNETNSGASEENELKELKQQLTVLCEEKQISKFESDDIIELLVEGEPVEWIVKQLADDGSNVDVAAATKLLTDIRMIVGPVKEPAEVASEETQEKAELVLPDIADVDFSQIDISQLSDMLPEGMQLPAGLDMKQLQEMMHSPQGKIMADLTAFCQEQGVDMVAMSNPQKMRELEAQWKETPRPAFDGKTPAEMLAAEPALVPPKVVTYRRDEPRIGRNDPCPCGSGKKYKKCCGKNI